ncbi:MAG TPA: serine/threonine-protein kinase [Planctomycetaceae bacterium]|nr:serine/threonine-protein kinase [Planctomycetaceae bacterium]
MAADPAGRPSATTPPSGSKPAPAKTAAEMGETFIPNDAPSAATAAPVSKPASTGPRTIGDFQLTKKLGQGGMGEVWLAKQISLDRVAAVKLLARHLAEKEDFVKRFYREAKAMAKVDHPQAVRVYAVSEAVDSADGVSKHFVAMEFVDGKSLQDWLDKLGKLSVPDALFITLRCAEALDHAHKLQMIHRDIKPDNVMITNKGVVKVADFGLAKALDDEEFSMTQSGTGLGTPYYMAPEQARNAKHVDGRSDIYALGATLYHILTGKHPFTGESLIELIKKKETGQFEPARKSNKEVPEKLDMILGKMMMREPDQRFKDCAEIIKVISSLGLAGTSLSFIDAPDKVQVAGSPASKPAAAPTRPAGTATSAPKTTAAPGGDVLWYVQYKTADGKDNIAKWSTAQVLQALRAGAIDSRAKVKKGPNDTFVPIAQFSEFETVVQGLLIKQKADKKAGDMKAMYAKIDKQEKWHKTNKWLKGMFSSAVGFVGFLIYLSVIAGVLVGGYFAWQAYGGKVLENVTKTDKPAAAAGENPQPGTAAMPK